MVQAYILPIAVAIPLLGVALFGSTSGERFGNVASAQYGADLVTLCLPLGLDIESYMAVTVPGIASDTLLERQGAVPAHWDGTCPGVPIEDLAGELAKSIFERAGGSTQ